jgi:hypothetical protein
VNNYHLSFKLTDKERREHVERLQAFARQISGKVANGEPLTEPERDFTAVALREWADAYNPKRPRGQSPEFSHADAALSYVLLRDRKKSHAQALGEVSDDLDKSEAAVWKAIKPLLPDAYAHLGINPIT